MFKRIKYASLGFLTGSALTASTLFYISFVNERNYLAKEGIEYTYKDHLSNWLSSSKKFKESYEFERFQEKIESAKDSIENLIGTNQSNDDLESKINN